MLDQSNNSELIEPCHAILSRITHEIRNCAALISSQLQLLEQMHPALEQYEEWESLMENMEYLQSLLNEVSAYNNASLIHLESVHTSAYLQSILASAKPAMNYLGIRLDIQIQPDLPDVLLDKTKIRQALLNLLRNAQDAVGSNGLIHFVAHSDKKNLILCVKDNGCGISPEHLPDLFQPFVTHKSNGTGLGLCIVQEIVQAHKGSITVDSIPGKGSTFSLILPYRSP